MDRAVRDGRDQHARRPPHERAPRLRVGRRLPLLRSDGHRQRPLGLAKATGLTAGLVGFLGAIGVPPVRRALEKSVLPKPGEGPSKEKRDAGHFTSHLVGLAEDAGLRVRAVVRGTADPGYGETAKMLGESCMCLAKDEGIATEGGVLTPASCMGMRLVERLRSARMTFAVPVDEAWRD